MDKEERLRELWALIPTVECRGYCWNNCTQFQITKLEREIIERDHGITIEPRDPDRDGLGEPNLCNAFDAETGQCLCHADRPGLCRILGTTESLPCAWKCKVKGKPLTHLETAKIMREIEALGGSFYYPQPVLAKILLDLQTVQGRKQAVKFYRNLAKELNPMMAAYAKRWPQGEPLPGTHCNPS